MPAIRPAFFLKPAAGLVILAALFFGTISARAAGRCYVKSTATGSNNGSSWGNAYKKLQSALSSPNCTGIWVAAGTYKPGTLRTDTFALKNGVKIYGGFKGTETLLSQRNVTANRTTLNGDIGMAGNKADNSYHVVFAWGVDKTAVLDGFTIRGGYADGSSSSHNGAGMYIFSSSPTLLHLTFTGNEAVVEGGGIYNLGSDPAPRLTDVIFSNNTALSGGGMYNQYSSPRLTRVTFSGNKGKLGAGGMDNYLGNPILTKVTFSRNSGYYGGGMGNAESNPGLTDVTFSNNSAALRGGGINNASSSSPILNRVTFSGNTAVETGGGIYNLDSNPSLRNVTFSGNSADFGGAIYNSAANPIITNATFSGNTAATSGGAVYNTSASNPTITNSILYGDTGSEIMNDSGAAVVTYSIVQGGYAGLGNLDADPVLGPLQNNGGFTKTMALPMGSLAIDVGDNAGCAAADQRGIPRPQDGNHDGSAICDMGATESRHLTTGIRSTGVQDGWVLEVAETTTTGGTMNNLSGLLLLGDDATDRQYRVILSFNTSALPDNAELQDVTLNVRRAGVVGTNPFMTHGNIVADVRKGAFNANPTLQIQDFQAGATKAGVLGIVNAPVNNWYSGAMGSADFIYINKTGITQFRLRFALDDNDNQIADLVKFYSGNASTASVRPQLVVTYYAP